MKLKEPQRLRVRRLLPECRQPFENSFGRSFRNVSVISGVEVEQCLAARGAMGLAVDENTILLSRRLDEMPTSLKNLVIGHELAHTVQLAQKGADRTDSLEAEAWAAAKAALRGERYTIRRQASHPLALSGVAFTMDHEGENYFKTFKVLNHMQGREQTTIEHIEVVKPMVFESLLKLMVQYSDYKSFVIDSHGTYDGYYMALATEHVPKNPTADPVAPANNDLVVILMRVGEIKKDMAAAEAALQNLPAVPKNGSKQAIAAATAALAKSTAAVRLQWEAILKKTFFKGDVKQLPSIGRIKTELQSWIANQAPKLALTESRMHELVQLMEKVRAKEINIVECRACDMGIWRKTLQIYRMFFGAQILGAPNVASFIGQFNLQANCGPGPFKKFMDKHESARIYGKINPEYPNNDTGDFSKKEHKVGLEINKISETVGTPIMAATSVAAATEWVEKFLVGTKMTFHLDNLPLHCMATKPPSVQGDYDWLYWQAIKYAAPMDPDGFDSAFDIAPINPGKDAPG